MGNLADDRRPRVNGSRCAQRSARSRAMRRGRSPIGVRRARSAGWSSSDPFRFSASADRRGDPHRGWPSRFAGRESLGGTRMATPQEILEALKEIKYPGYTRDIVSFGMVRDIEIATAGVTVTLTSAGARPEALEAISAAVREQVRRRAGVSDVTIVIQEPERPRPAAPARRVEIAGIRHIVAVASGKGGVGKSTVAVNLALALRALGYSVGLLDADVYGPSVPVMLGLDERPRTDAQDRIVPLERFGIKVISLGLFIATAQPVIWRGPMITKLLTQFLREVEWGALDVLVLDLPPGTGDAQLTIAQQAPLSGGVIVTTPQEVALLDVQRGIAMFNQVNAPVLGVIENMSFHVCS